MQQLNLIQVAGVIDIQTASATQSKSIMMVRCNQYTLIERIAGETNGFKAFLHSTGNKVGFLPQKAHHHLAIIH